MRQWTIDPLPLPVGERWVNPLPDEASRAKWEPEKKTRFAGLFFLTGLRPVLPLGQWLQAGMARNSTLLAQRGMARLRVLVLPLGHHLHVYVPTTKHGSVLLSRFAMPGLSEYVHGIV